MKHLSILFLSCLLFCSPFYIHAQSFTVAHDTVYVIPGADTAINNDINNLTTSPINVGWKISATNFPAGWTPGSAICDVNLCYDAGGLWPSGVTEHTGPAIAPGSNVYRVILNLTSVPSTGIYYLTVIMHNAATPTDSASETYITAAGTTSGVRTIAGTDETLIYPNPAGNELNIVYAANEDVKNIAVYIIIGKLMAVYKVTANNSANLNLENIPSGIYFVRLVNAYGAAVATRKFTKQ